MGTIPKPKPDAGRGKILSTALLALALLAGLIGFAPIASAHHAEVTLQAECPVNGQYKVTWTAKSWKGSTRAEKTIGQGYGTNKNGNVTVQYKIGNGYWQTITKTGEFNYSNGYQFSGNFQVNTNQTAYVRVRDTGHWSNGSPASNSYYPNTNGQSITAPNNCQTSVTPVAPTPSDATCESPQSITMPSTPGITYTYSGKLTGPGSVTITAKLADSAQYKWAADSFTGWESKWSSGGRYFEKKITLGGKLTGDQCKTEVTPVAPTPSDATCESPQSITMPSTPGITYTYSGKLTGPGSVTITAKLADSAQYKWAADSFTGWESKWSSGGRYFEKKITLGGKLTGDQCKTEVTPVVPDIQKGDVCDAPETVTIPTTTGIKYTYEGSLAGPGYVTITATPESGHKFPAAATGSWQKVNNSKSWKITLQLGKNDPCGQATPVAPTWNPATCEAPGSVTPPNDGDGVSYAVVEADGTITVTASIANPSSTVWAAASFEGWTKDGNNFVWSHATQDKLNCVTPVNPTVNQSNVCDVPDTLVVPATNGIRYELNGTDVSGQTLTGPQSGTLTAVATEGHVLSEPWSYSFNLDAGAECGQATPVAPTWNPATCEVPGSVTPPENGDGVSYAVVEADGTITVTASIANPSSTVWAAASFEGWTKDGNNFVWSHDTEDQLKCVTAVDPEVSESETCDVPDTLTIPTSEGVLYLLAGTDGNGPAPTTITGPATGTLIATAMDGFTLTNPDWSYAFNLKAGEPCTYLVQPSKTWDFGEGNSVPSDGEARVTITAGELSKTWRFNTQGEMLGDEDAKAPLEVPMGTEYEVSETFTNPSGWSCEMVEMPAPVAANQDVEKANVYNRCTIVTIPTIPEQPTSTTSTTEEVGGIDEEPTTTTEAPTTTEPEVLDTVVTPTTVAKQTLPKTGSNTSTVLSLAGVLMTAGAAFVLFGRRRFNAGN